MSLCVVLLETGCGTAPSECPDWTIPVPVGTPVYSYEPVSPEERNDHRIELVRDLEIGDSDADSDAYLFQFVDGWKDLTVDGQGNIYVVDTLNYRVQVFDTGGQYVRTLGTRGEGPGQMSQFPRSIAIAGDRISVAPTNGARVTEWNLAGDFLGRRDLGVGSWITALEGTDTGDLIASYQAAIAAGDWRRTVHIARLPSGDSEALVYLDHVDPGVAEDVGESNSEVPPQVMLGVHRPSFAVTRSGDLYLSGGDEYQLLALRVSGAARWALRVAGSRRMPTESQQTNLLKQIRASGISPEERAWFETATRQSIQVVGPWPAISSIRVDGHGHVYVFPEISEFPGTYTERPVDVYSSEGQRLFSGYIPVSRSIISRLAYAVTTMAPILPREPAWTAALGDHVYTIEQDAESGEDVVVRYKLVEPF